MPEQGFDPRKLRQIKSFGQDTAAPSVAVAPAARSFAAILIAIGVPDEDLDGVKDLMMQMETKGLLPMPTSFEQIAVQVRKVWQAYQDGERLVIDAVEG